MIRSLIIINPKASISAADAIFKDFDVPSIASISFHKIRCWDSSTPSSSAVNGIDLSSLPMFAHFTDAKTNFAYLKAVLDTSAVPASHRPYLPLFTALLLESPMQIGNTFVPYEAVVKHLNQETIENSGILKFVTVAHIPM